MKEILKHSILLIIIALIFIIFVQDCTKVDNVEKFAIERQFIKDSVERVVKIREKENDSLKAVISQRDVFISDLKVEQAKLKKRIKDTKNKKPTFKPTTTNESLAFLEQRYGKDESLEHFSLGLNTSVEVIYELQEKDILEELVPLLHLSIFNLEDTVFSLEETVFDFEKIVSNLEKDKEAVSFNLFLAEKEITERIKKEKRNKFWKYAAIVGAGVTGVILGKQL